MHKAVGVNPFVSLLAIFAFSSLFGLAGALMAIPLAAVLQLLLDRFVFHPGTMEAVAADVLLLIIKYSRGDAMPRHPNRHSGEAFR